MVRMTITGNSFESYKRGHFPFYYGCLPLKIGRVKGACYDGEINGTNVVDQVHGLFANTSYPAATDDSRPTVHAAGTYASRAGSIALGASTKRCVDV